METTEPSIASLSGQILALQLVIQHILQTHPQAGPILEHSGAMMAEICDALSATAAATGNADRFIAVSDLYQSAQETLTQLGAV